MHTIELFSCPRDLLIASAVAAGVGVLLFLIANLIMKVIGLDINEYARESERYRYMDFFDQTKNFYSDFRNMPVLIAFFGIFLVILAVLTALGSGVWILVRIVAGPI